ncbi:hypothetical protein Scep_013237 [Stephania cephalantha]|uniref:Uncharacterized protein n=1 Tax=Stephania cephalantha TaxID=152367 RepID=A0AAP0JGR4_9MAGN
MSLDGLVPFVYLVWLGVLRLGLNEVVIVQLPKYPCIKRKDSFIQFFAITGILLLSMRSLGQKYRINDPQDENSLSRRARLPHRA